MENKLYMLSTKSCTRCPVVKAQLAEKDVDVEYIDVEEDPTLAAQHGLMQVPSIIDNRLEDSKHVYTGQTECLQFVNSL